MDRPRRVPPRCFPVVVGTDGSTVARAAVATTLMFPWPDGVEVHGVVARRTRAAAGRPSYVVDAFDRAFAETAAQAKKQLAARWPDGDASVVDHSPAEAILGEARRVGARVIVVGQRGHGRIGRLLLGSTSRAVTRRAQCPVLVVNRRPGEIRRLVIGVDGSANAHRAVAFVAEMRPPPGGTVTVVGALEPAGLLPHQLLPAAVHRSVRRKLATMTDGLSVTARREIDDAVTTLRAAGWRVRTVLREGRALDVLLAAVQGTNADLLVLGARGVTTLDALLVGSVAEGALSYCRVPVLLVR